MTIKYKSIFLATGFAVLFSGFAHADTEVSPAIPEPFVETQQVTITPQKFDTKIAQAAANKAAQKIGTIRGTISHDERPKLVTHSNLEKPSAEKSLIPRPAQVPVKERNALPPLVQNNEFGIDATMTGSVKKNSLPPVNADPKLQWDRFNHLGRLIKSGS